MKALSIRQPWAWLIVNGHKSLENRSRHTNMRGEVLIHAGKTIDVTETDYNAWKQEVWELDHVKLPEYSELQTGGIIGKVEIIDSTDNPQNPDDQKWYDEGAIGWILRNPEPLPFKACKGQLGFFTPNPN